MSARKSLAAFLAVSVMVHGAFDLAMTVPENSLSAAGPPPALTAQGNSFADMVQGSSADVPDMIPPSAINDATATEAEAAQAGIQLQSAELSETPGDVLAYVALPTVTAIQPVVPAEIASVQPQIIEALPDV